MIFSNRIILIFSAVILLLGVVLALYLRDSKPKAQKRPTKANILIYLVDTLRADHLSVYGYNRKTCPNLEDFAKDAVLFRDAYTPSSWTRPATASLLTGLAPRKHGAVSKTNKIPDQITLINELLKNQGYHTAAFSANPNILPLWGFDQGFSVFKDIRGDLKNPGADIVVPPVIEHLKKTPNTPFFVYVHTVDPHGPNDPPEPYRSMWPRTFQTQLERVSDITPTTSKDVVEDFIAAYDQEIVLNDEYFGKLIRYLKDRELYDDLMIFYVADHGEEFQDHGGGGHAHTLYQELVSIPMIVKFPQNWGAGKQIDSRVNLLDVVPTILDQIGAKIPENMDGNSLYAIINSTKKTNHRTQYFDLDVERSDGSVNASQAILKNNLKYVETYMPVEARELYNITNDPHEQKNFYDETDSSVSQLKKELYAKVARNQGGFYFRFVNEDGLEKLVYSGTLKTTGKFTNTKGWQLEDEDVLKNNDEEKSLTFRVQLQNQKLVKGRRKGQLQLDEDIISFSVSPADAQVMLEDFTSDLGQSFYLGDGKFENEKIPFQFNQHLPVLRSRAVASFVPISGGGDASRNVRPGGYLYVIPFQGEAVAEADDETKERLRALGYIQ